MIEDSESDGEDEGLRQGPGAGVGASVRAVLTAGRLVASDGTGGGGSASGASGCAGVGPDGKRHQAAVAEARRHLGGGGKRGWAEWVWRLPRQCAALAALTGEAWV